MPPKKEKAEEAPPPPPVDTNPYGAFVTVTVPEALLQLAGAVESARVFLSVSYSPDWAPLQSEHAPVPAEAAAAAVAVPMQLSKAFRVEASMAGLHQLLNATITVAVHDAVSGVVLATAPLDLLPLARGNQAFSLQHVQLTCAEPSPKSAMQAVSALLPSLAVSLAVRHAPADVDPAAAPPAATEQLPDPEPWFFVSPEDAANANVVELLVSGFDPAPAGLLTAAAAAREGKTPGRMTLQLGLALPGGAPALMSPALPLPPAGAPAAPGAEAGGTVAALGPQAVRVRQYITADQARELLYALEDEATLYLEVARYLQHDQLQDPRWDHYHAAVQLQGVEVLAELGSTEYRSADPLPVRAFASAPGLTSVLPTYAPSNVKGKPIEEANTSEPSGAWEAAGSTATVALALAAPLAPSWSAPPPPPVPLESLLALRPHPGLGDRRAAVASPSSPAADAFQRLASELGAALKALALAPDASSPELAGGGLTARQLAEELRANGRYSAMARALGTAAAAVAEERFRAAHGAGIAGAPTGPDASVVDALREELHALLSQQASQAFSAPRAPSAHTPGSGDDGALAAGGDSKAARLLVLAMQCEDVGQAVRAESLHQRRVLLSTPADSGAEPTVAVAVADAWYEYGAFCMRCGQLGRGEECFRQALAAAATAVASDPELPSAAVAAKAAEAKCRLALAACLVHQGRVTDPLYLKEAEELLGALVSAAAAAAGLAPEASMAGTLAPGSIAAAEPSTISVAASVAGAGVSGGGGGTATPTPLTSMPGLPIVVGGAGLGVLAALEPEVRRQVAVLRALLLQAAGDKRKAAAAIALQQLASVEAAELGSGAVDVTAPAGPSASSISASAAAAATDEEVNAEHQVQEGNSSTIPAPMPAPVHADANPCLACARWLLSLGLPWLALSALELAPLLPLTGGALATEVTLAQAEALHLLGEEESRAQALTLLQELQSQAPSPAMAAAAHELAGHVHFKAGHHSEAVHAYQDTLAARGASAPSSSRLYLQLAQAYEALGFPDYALAVYTQACSVAPTAQAWLGVSACRLATGDAAAASLALTEAAALDPENPVVWGRTALLAFKGGHKQEAANALKCAVRLGREDIPGALTLPLMSELATEYSKLLGLDLEAARGAEAALTRRLELQTILWALDSADGVGTRGVLAGA